MARRAVAALALAALVVAACQPPPKSDGVTAPVPTDRAAAVAPPATDITPAPSARAAAGPAATPGPVPAPTAPAPAATAAPTSAPSAPAEPPPTAAAPSGSAPPAPAPPAPREPPPAEPAPGAPDDLAGLGALCRPYLRADYARLVVEIDHQSGAAPTDAAVEHLLRVLRSVVAKPAGVVLAGGGEIPGGARTWTVDDLRGVASQHRSQYSSVDQVVLYLLAVRGAFEDDAIGVAYRASEFAVFPDQIGDLATLLGGRAVLERAVLVHEAGHLLCLVNLTYTSALDHADPDHPHHSRDPNSVMYYAVETSAVAQVFNGAPPSDFTAADRADLEGLRTGRY
jgi:hypothetical protein